MSNRVKFSRVKIEILITSLLLGIVRWLSPERSMMDTGSAALIDAVFSLGLLALVLLFSWGVGLKVLRFLKVAGMSEMEQAIFGLSIGLSVIAYGVLGLGLAGFLKSWALLLWLIVIGIWAQNEWGSVAEEIPSLWMAGLRALRRIGLGRRVLLAVFGLIFSVTLLQAMSPPWDYDGLMYHLQGPKLFLESGRITLLPENWGANGPFTIEMLFTLGLAFGSDTFAKLVHLTYAVLLVLGTFVFGQRYLKKNGGWISAAVLVGIPIFPIWASLAYADMAWATYEFLALYAFILWHFNRQRNWLFLSGLLTGLALGSKYLAIGNAAILGLGVLWNSRENWKGSFVNALLFGGAAFLVSFPWYLKNWVWTGNPVYPLYFGGAGWTENRVDWLMTYLNSFGTGQGLWDYLLLPWNVYAQHLRFGTFKGSLELPSLLFPLALLCFWKRSSKIINLLAFITLFRFVIWVLGSHQTRFLLPIFPQMALLTSSSFLLLVENSFFRRWGRILTQGLVGGVVAATLVFSIIFLIDVSPHRVIFGFESKDLFLRRMLADYPAKIYLQEALSPDQRVLMMWDGQGYYCDERCLPDTENSRWTRLITSFEDPILLATHLRNLGVTHLLFSIGDADYILQHDPFGEHLRAAKFFLQKFSPDCTKEIFRDQWVSLFEITCGQ